MMRISALAVFALALALTSAARAGQQVIPADIGITFTAAPNTDLHAGESINGTLTVTNFGPGAANYLVVQSSSFTNEFGSFAADPEECFVFATVVDAQPAPYYYLNWQVANVLGAGTAPFRPGETRTCHLTFSLSPTASPSMTFGWNIPSFFVDLNSANNASTVLLQLAAVPVPAVAPLGSAILCLLVALIGATFGITASSTRGERDRRTA
jgi:hypothetical protein